MDKFIQSVQLRWSDIDANFHLRHSAYYDWATMARVNFLFQQGLTAEIMSAEHFGPVLFREECIFKKEIKYGDAITINTEVLKAKRDYSRWTIQHEIFREEKTVCAIVTVDAAWLDTKLRKLTIPSEFVQQIFAEAPRSGEFSWTD